MSSLPLINQVNSPASTGAVFDHFASLAAKVTGAGVAVVYVAGLGVAHPARQSSHGLSRRDLDATVLFNEVRGWPDGLTVIPDMDRVGRLANDALVKGHLQLRFIAHLPLVAPSGERIGFVCVLDQLSRSSLTSLETASLQQIADLVVADRKREQRHAHVMHVANLALRADRMLRLVTEAGSCATALTSLLEEICRYHDAALGHIWELTLPDDALQEVSQFRVLPPTNANLPQPTDPAQLAATVTAEAIRCNCARTVVHSMLGPASRVHIFPYVTEAGFLSQVSVPIWVEQQRFGLSLAFTIAQVNLQAVVDDITSLANTIRPALFRKVTEERTRFAAQHDELTGLSNRRFLQERLADAVSAASWTGQEFALLYLDLDGFKVINDSRGHDAGDALLTAVAARIQGTIRTGDVVARMGGDEFVVLQQLEKNPSSAALLSQRLINALEEPFVIGGQASTVGVSIGIATYPADGRTPGQLIHNADTALYRAKEAGRNTFRHFDISMQERQQLSLIIKQELHTAVEMQQISLAYQPICDATSLQVRGFEALLRWTHPARGTISPEDFIPVAEATGIIVPLGRWALWTACSKAARHHSAITISVNLSPRQFRQSDLPQQIAEILAQTGLSGSRLDLEVTEGLLLDSSGVVLKNMQELRKQGIRITLDDFGTAYASLSYLRRFPFNRIKIDKSFVQCLDDNTTSSIVETILSLGRRLNLDVVAEGVETEQQLLQVRNLGCQLVQGFLMGRPEPDYHLVSVAKCESALVV